MTSTYPTLTTDRGKVVSYDPAVIADHADEVTARLAAASRFLAADLAEARKVAERYSRGPRTVATEGYAAKPGKVTAAQHRLDLAREAWEGGAPLTALAEARAANDAYCGGQSQMGLPDVLSEAAGSIWSAWREAVAAAR